MKLTEFLRGPGRAPTRAIPKSQPVQTGVTLARGRPIAVDNRQFGVNGVWSDGRGGLVKNREAQALPNLFNPE